MFPSEHTFIAETFITIVNEKSLFLFINRLIRYMITRWIILLQATDNRNQMIMSFQELKSEKHVLNLVFCLNYFNYNQSVGRWVVVGGSVGWKSVGRWSLVLIKPETDRESY